jgi:hypothetical protein
MRNPMLSAASAAALAIVATDARPAAAQEAVSGGSLSSAGYYLAPAYYGGNYARYTAEPIRAGHARTRGTLTRAIPTPAFPGRPTAAGPRTTAHTVVCPTAAGPSTFGAAEPHTYTT